MSFKEVLGKGELSGMKTGSNKDVGKMSPAEQAIPVIGRYGSPSKGDLLGKGNKKSAKIDVGEKSPTLRAGGVNKTN